MSETEREKVIWPDPHEDPEREPSEPWARREPIEDRERLPPWIRDDEENDDEP